MKRAIINKLFSREELHFNESIHSNLITKIISVLLDKKAEGLLEQSEYLVQDTINDYLVGHLRHTLFTGYKEVNAFGQKRIDNAVIQVQSKSPLVFYEVKSYIRSNENRVNSRLVYQDILKLAIKKKELPYTEAYLLLAGREKVIKKALVEDKTLLLPHKFDDRYNRSSNTFDIKFFISKHVEESIIRRATNDRIKKISLSPSRWRNYGGMAVITWRVNKVL
jgi:hypothetical protein